MEFLGQFSIGRFDFGFVGRARYAEDGVKVTGGAGGHEEGGGGAARMRGAFGA